MILAETHFKTYDKELLAIVKVFETRWHYLEDCKLKVLVLTDYNNLRLFINRNSVSFRQLWWAQKLLQYYFEIDY